MGTTLTKYSALAITFTLLLLGPSVVFAQGYRFVTGFLPPWSMANDAQYPGFFVEIAREVDRRLGNETKIEVYPWARALELARQNSNVIVFPVARTKEREGKFTWIEAIKPMEMVFVSLKTKVHSLDSAKSLGRVLVHKDAPPDQYLEVHNFKNLVKLNTLTPSIPRMLSYGRADAWYTPKDMANWMWKLNPEVDTPYFSEPSTNDDLTFAGSPRLSPLVADEFRAVLRTLREEKFIEKVIQGYRR